MKHHLLTLSILVLLGWVPLLGQAVRINEFLASNVTNYPDNTDFDDYSDWIELTNTSSQPVALDGYYLSDDPDNPLKWAIPSGVIIPANGFFLVRADGFDAAPGQTYSREFSPWGSFQTKHYHTSFKLAEEGESVSLAKIDHRRFGDVVLLDLGSEWRYLDSGADPGRLWFEPGFDDGTWFTGAAQLGYGEDDQETTIDFGGNDRDKFPAAYFRRAVDVESPQSLTNIELRLLADDGAVVFLNGVEVGRFRMGAGEIDYRSYASDRSSEDDFDVVALSSDQLREGRNVIAVEVHQVSATSSDLSFDLEMVANRVPDEFEQVDLVNFGFQAADTSYGRDGTGAWTFFEEPTPGSANTSLPVKDLSPVSDVVYSTTGGFYEVGQSIRLTCSDAAARIHYTVDGSWPTRASARYEGPIDVGQTTVVRARAFVDGKLPSVLATETYFIEAPKHDVPVIAFTVAPEIFFDDALGIYENVYKGREAPVNLAFFEGGDLAFQVNAGAKIGGENIWRFAQKPLNIALRGKYGDDAISYQLFPEQRLGSFSRFGLRNGGDNWDDAMLRDGLTPRIMRGQMDNDVEDYRPTVLYMNGRYWGIHNLRSSLDPAYFAATYQLDPENIDHLEYGHVTSSRVTLGAKEGDTDDYLALEAYAADNDLSDPVHYAFMESRMDIDNFIDFVCIEDFVNNTSWEHNREFWRERAEGAKWRWIVPDLDRGLNTSNQTTSLLDNFEDDFDLFGDLMENEVFRARLGQRYAVHLSSTFHPDRIADIVDGADAEVRSEIERHIERWRDDDGVQSLDERQEQLDEIKEFARERAPHVYSDFRDNFGMPDTVDVTVNVSPPEGGQVRMNGVPMLPGYDRTVELFEGLVSEVEAVAAPGYEFDGWSTDSVSARLEFTPQSAMTLTATFRPVDETVLPLVIESDLTLGAGDYTAKGDLVVPSGVTLTLSEGVRLRLAPLADLRVAGNLQILGSKETPVRVESRSGGKRWGSIAIVDGEGVSHLSHVILRGGSVGADPVLERGAISIIRSEVVMEHLDMDDVIIPIFGWESKVTLRSSSIHTPFTGDGINVKHGEGLVEDCTFRGNTARDTDAIDFDDVDRGVIRNNRIHAFRGSNSDGIDVGEGCVDLLVTGNRIYNNSDKGISVGQASTVRIERNLIVGCAQGVGIKDSGSTAWIDQNTFVQCDIGVAVFEKNLGAGGGRAEITNSIFSQSKEAPVTVDSLSALSVAYSLSDTSVLSGTNNLTDDPGFSDPGIYDFSLTSSSPARNAGDPSHPRDADGSLADLGAYYTYDPEDYPFQIPNVVVINEILSHSDNGAPDWIELYNTSSARVDIGGWFVSDSKSDLRKYQIAAGTVLPPKGYLVLDENETFGEASEDVGKRTAFALNENGETVYLFAPGEGGFLDYLEEESFGPSLSGVSKGRYLKSTNTYNFVAMDVPTPGAANSEPDIGPLVISEIMYRPDLDGDAEYLELLNVSDGPITLYDPIKETAWRFTAGIVFDFPVEEPVTVASGERLLLVRDEVAFRARFPEVPGTTRIFQWLDSGLSNGGERLELSRPGDVDALGKRQWIRVDRVTYGDDDLWPVEADGGGLSLTRLRERGYGNDVWNWFASQPTPGTAEGDVPDLGDYESWAAKFGLNSFERDADADGIPNGVEYALGLDPKKSGRLPESTLRVFGDAIEFRMELPSVKSDVVYVIETSRDLVAWDPAETLFDGQVMSAMVAHDGLDKCFVRLGFEQVKD